MGSMICTMGAGMQVFAITHLPQVAAKGQAHFLVSRDASGEARSTIKKLSPEERVLEIARMLSGSVISEEAVANARRLLQLGLSQANVDISDECTYCSHDKYWSHRYTKGQRGSQAAAIVLR